MLLCIDGGKTIRVFRLVQSETGPAKRERVGVISKKDYAIGDAFAGLDAADTRELKDAIELYRQQERLKTRLAVLSFPETVRAVLDHVDATDDATLRWHVRTAFFEGLRVMRKANTEKTTTNTPSPFL